MPPQLLLYGDRLVQLDLGHGLRVEVTVHVGHVAQEHASALAMPMARRRVNSGRLPLYCLGGMPVDWHDTNSSPPGRLAQIVV